MVNGISIQVLGDFGPFSRMGKSIGYMVTFGDSSYLIDCGAPLFQQIGGHGLKEIKGLIITHCHDDHKRWFTDLSLFNRYATDINRKTMLLTCEDVHEELVRSAGPALDRSLSDDSMQVVDIGFDEFVDFRALGPRARYRIVTPTPGTAPHELCIADSAGRRVGPDKAKIMVSPKSGRPRMLFLDPDLKEWVEPESFYTFSSPVFYEDNQNLFTDSSGLVIEAIKAPVWHGISAIGVRIIAEKHKVTFSSDTIHNIDVWQRLWKEKRQQNTGMSRDDFESASVIRGDINNFIERAWSKQRYDEAVQTFSEGAVVHDISARKSVVHTDYENLDRTHLRKDHTILTHSPDLMTSEWALCNTDKAFIIIDDNFFEIAGDQIFRMDADVYHKEGGRYFVGYRNDQGNYIVYEDKGLLGLTAGKIPASAQLLFRIDLYEDIRGSYYPKLNDAGKEYRVRSDGKVELLETTENGSRGIIVSCRSRSSNIKE
jgi:hypothetical protein